MKQFSKVNTFFMEILIIILFFSICSAIIINFFAVSNKKAQESSEINRAIILAQNYAEKFKKNPNSILEDACINMSAIEDASTFEFWYDENFRTTSIEPKYIVNIIISKDSKNSDMLIADISVNRKKDSLNLFSLKTGKFVGTE